MMGTSGKGDESGLQNKNSFYLYNDGFISTSNSEQKNKQTETNMYFIAASHKFTKILKKYEKTPK